MTLQFCTKDDNRVPFLAGKLSWIIFISDCSPWADHALCLDRIKVVVLWQYRGSKLFLIGNIGGNKFLCRFFSLQFGRSIIWDFLISQFSFLNKFFTAKPLSPLYFPKRAFFIQIIGAFVSYAEFKGMGGISWLDGLLLKHEILQIQS